VKSIISPELTINLIKHRFITSKHIIISKASRFWKGLGFHDSFFNSKRVRFSRLKSHRREREREERMSNNGERFWLSSDGERDNSPERVLEQRRWERKLTGERERERESDWAATVRGSIVIWLRVKTHDYFLRFSGCILR